MIKRIIIDALALLVASLVVPGITLTDPWSVRGILTILGVAVIFGIVNAIVKPIFKVLTGCFIMLTFGLFLLIINGLMMWLVSWASGQLGLGWHVGTLLAAIEGGVIVAVVSFLAAKLLKEK